MRAVAGRLLEVGLRRVSMNVRPSSATKHPRRSRKGLEHSRVSALWMLAYAFGPDWALYAPDLDYRMAAEILVLLEKLESPR
jgi:hypothetical protein